MSEETNIEVASQEYTDPLAPPSEPQHTDEAPKEAPYELAEKEEEVQAVNEENQDPYGVDTEQPTEEKLYTKKEVDERINETVRQRLERERQRLEALYQQKPPEQQQGQSNEDWEAELTKFIERTYSNIEQKRYQQAIEAQERQATEQFQQKILSGKERYKDFEDVIASQPINETMAMASRSLEDPAGFWYAAGKRAPEELQRIAQLQDPYAQVAEIARLDTKLRTGKKPTNAPKPIQKISGSVDGRDTRQPTIEELIADSEKKALERRRR